MGEEFARWLDAARPAWPWVAGAAVLVAATWLLSWFLLRQRFAAAKAAERRAARLWHNIDCVVEDTQAIDMRPLVAHADKARFNPGKVLSDLRERARDAVEPGTDGPNWTPEELAEVKAMNDRALWPLACNYEPRGLLPRLKVRTQRVTPADLAARVKRIREEQKQTEVGKA